MTLLLASAATLLFQGMQQRTLSITMEARMMRATSSVPPLPGSTGNSSGENDTTNRTEDNSSVGRNSSTHTTATKNASSSPRPASPPSSSPFDNITLSDDPNWMDMTDFYVYLDAFSDSWFMSTQLFVQSKDRIDAIDAVEEACFAMFDGREDKVRMSLDWLDCGVEHMSKWWRTAEAPKNEYANRVVVDFLRHYVDARLVHEGGEARTSAATEHQYIFDEQQQQEHVHLQPTVALIAFQAYTEPGAQRDASLNARCRELTVASLAATIASLVHVGMGRILVVGHEQERLIEKPLILEAFDLVSGSAKASNIGGNNETTQLQERAVRGSHLVYVTVPTDMVHTDFAGVNLPRGALLGLYQAFTGGDAAWTKMWLGEDALTDPASLWKYVYLTEPDTLLHIRPRTVATMTSMMQQGLILAPHRLQPIPYQADFPEATAPKHTLLPVDQVASSPFPVIATLYAATDACCDDQRGEHRPGSHDAIGSHCGDFWWRCGYLPKDVRGDKKSNEAGNHSRIVDNYHLIRLQQGTGVTTLAGSEHGRRCIPVAGGGCKRKVKEVPKDVRRPKYPWVTPSKEKK